MLICCALIKLHIIKRKTMSKNNVLLAFLCSFCFTLNASADYIDGQRAYASGNYEAAISEWTQVAQEGNARAQYNLGWMHEAKHLKTCCKQRPS